MNEIKSLIRDNLKKELMLNENLDSLDLEKLNIDEKELDYNNYLKEFDKMNLDSLKLDSLDFDERIYKDSIKTILNSEKEKQMNKKVEVKKEVRK